MKRLAVLFIPVLICLTALSAANAQVCNTVKNCNKIKTSADARIAEIKAKREYSKGQVRVVLTSDGHEGTDAAYVKCIQATDTDPNGFVGFFRQDAYEFQMSIPNPTLAVGTYDLTHGFEGSYAGRSLSGSKSCSLTVTANGSKNIEGTFNCTRTASGGLSTGSSGAFEFNFSGSFSCSKKSYCSEDYDLDTPEYKSCVQAESHWID